VADSAYRERINAQLLTSTMATPRGSAGIAAVKSGFVLLSDTDGL
jgi:hypothetical protein